MIDLAELLVGLTEMIPIAAGTAEAGLAIEVESMEVDLPLEAQLAADAGLLASFPRGRLATAFDPALGRLAASFAVRSR